MNDVAAEKLALIDTASNAAAILTGCIMLGNGGKLPGQAAAPTGAMSDPNTQQVVDLQYEMAKSIYWGLKAALADETGVWPDPLASQAPAQITQSSIISLLNQVSKVPGVPATVPSLITQIIAALGVPSAPASGNSPSGATSATPAAAVLSAAASALAGS